MGSRDPILKYWDPIISRERLKLETSNLARRRTAVNIGSKLVMWGHVTKFWNFGTTLMTRERLKQETSNLARRRTAVSFNKKMQNWVKRGHVGSRDPLLEFLDPPNISLTFEASNFKFGTETEGSEF